MGHVRDLKFSEYFGSHKKSLIKCDLQVSSKCRNEYQKENRYIFGDREKYDGKDICNFCLKKSRYVGRKNPNCKHHTLDDEMMGYIDTEEEVGDWGEDKRTPNMVFETIFGVSSRCGKKLRGMCPNPDFLINQGRIV